MSTIVELQLLHQISWREGFRYPTIVPKTVTTTNTSFFGRRELNEPLFNNDIVENDDDIDLNNESDVLMVSDDELEVNERFSFLKQQPLDGLNRISSTNNLKNLEIHEFIIDPTENIDDELEDSFTTVPQSKKKVRDYFKLNIRQ